MSVLNSLFYHSVIVALFAVYALDNNNCGGNKKTTRLPIPQTSSRCREDDRLRQCQAIPYNTWPASARFPNTARKNVRAKKVSLQSAPLIPTASPHLVIRVPRFHVIPFAWAKGLLSKSFVVVKLHYRLCWYFNFCLILPSWRSTSVSLDLRDE